MSVIGRNSLLLKFGFESRSKSCSVSDLGISFISTVIIVLLSGPNSMFAMAISARDGKCGGFLGVLGIFTSDEILMVSRVAGVTSLILSQSNNFQRCYMLEKLTIVRRDRNLR